MWTHNTPDGMRVRGASVGPVGGHFAFLVGLVLLYVAFTGAGAYSLDDRRERRRVLAGRRRRR